jgi:hypothetical protein
MSTCGSLDKGWSAQVDVAYPMGDDGHIGHGGSIGTASCAQARHQRYLRPKSALKFNTVSDG